MLNVKRSEESVTSAVFLTSMLLQMGLTPGMGGADTITSEAIQGRAVHAMLSFVKKFLYRLWLRSVTYQWRIP